MNKFEKWWDEDFMPGSGLSPDDNALCKRVTHRAFIAGMLAAANVADELSESWYKANKRGRTSVAAGYVADLIRQEAEK